MEVVIAIKMQVPTHRVYFNDEVSNKKKLQSNLHTLEDIKDEAHMKTTTYQQHVAWYYKIKK